MSTQKVIALAGVGTIGKGLLDALLAHGKYQVVVLSRQPQPDLEAKGARVAVVDYSNKESLVPALQGVHTLLCLLWANGDMYTPQVNLIRAAEEAGVKRFAPSEWSSDTKKFPEALSPYYDDKPRIHEVLAKSSLEYTLFFTGLFMDYLAKEKGYLRVAALPVDIPTATANIPGTGNEPFSMTAVEDIAKYVIAALDDERKWPEVMGIEGSRTTWNKVLEAAEKATGKKFQVTYKPIDQIRAEYTEAKNDPSPNWLKAFHLSFDLGLAEGKFAVPSTARDLYPEIKPVTEVELIQRSWGSN